jgi:hypothetical protein
MWVREDGLIVVEQIARHTDRRSGQDEPVFPPLAVIEDHCFVRCNVLYVRAGTVAKAEGFLNVGCEVGKFLRVTKEGRKVGFAMAFCN